MQSRNADGNVWERRLESPIYTGSATPSFQDGILEYAARSDQGCLDQGWVQDSHQLIYLPSQLGTCLSEVCADGTVTSALSAIRSVWIPILLYAPGAHIQDKAGAKAREIEMQAWFHY